MLRRLSPLSITSDRACDDVDEPTANGTQAFAAAIIAPVDP